VSSFGINVPMLYTTAYTAFGVKCLVAPAIPNNAGSLAPITVSASEGSILNAPRPCAVSIRHVIGQMLPDVVFGCLHQALADGAPAEGASALWIPQLRGGHGVGDASGAGTPFNVLSFHSGGTGARPAKDGLSATAFPSGVRSVPVEIVESIAPVVIWRKEYRPDSGGPGRRRGGLGQVMEIGSAENAPFSVYAMFERIEHPARGRRGGHDGAPGRVSLASGTPLRGKGQQTVPPGERLRLELPGGGGYGDPRERDRAQVEADVRNGLVTPEAAERVYGFAPDPATGNGTADLG
jgi:N-methylhydantoinase B